MTIFHLYHQTGRIARKRTPQYFRGNTSGSRSLVRASGLRCITTTTTTRSKVSSEQMIALSIQACIINRFDGEGERGDEEKVYCSGSTAGQDHGLAWLFGEQEDSKGEEGKGASEAAGEEGAPPIRMAHQEMERRCAVARMRITGMRTRMGPRPRAIALGRARRMTIWTYLKG